MNDDNLVHVTRIEQAQEMRVVRNACREFMTGDQHEITPDEQTAWFASLPPLQDETVLPFLYRPRRAPTMGYGLIRLIGDRWWVSGGLLPEYRGKGYGTDLFWELTAYVHAKRQTSWLHVFEDNLVARRTYTKLGYVEDGATIDGAPFARAILTMKMGYWA